MTIEQQLELMRGILNDLIVKVDKFAENSEKRDIEYDRLRRRILRGALGLLGVDETEGENPV